MSSLKTFLIAWGIVLLAALVTVSLVAGPLGINYGVRRGDPLLLLLGALTLFIGLNVFVGFVVWAISRVGSKPPS